MVKRKINLSLLVLLIACSSGSIYNKVNKIPDQVWNANQIFEYNVPVSDTLNGYDIKLHLRNDYDFSYRNIWLFIETTSPNGNVLHDTVEFFLADQSGKWLGKGLGNFNTMLLTYKQNIRFPVSGIYNFKIEQAMRTNELNNVMDIGLRIDKTKIK